MAKATALTSDLMNVSEAQPPVISPRAIDDPKPKKAATAKAEKMVPLQIRIPASEAKSIKRDALEADQTISDFMLACYHANKQESLK